MSISIMQATIPSGRTGAVDLTPEEWAFHDRPELSHWWEVKHSLSELGAASPHLLDRKAGHNLVQGGGGEALPTIASSGGVSGAAYVQGRTADPAGRFISEAGAAVIPASGDWSIWAVAKNGSSAQSVLAAVVGSDGGALRIALRSGDLIKVSHFNSAGVEQAAVVTTAATTAAWHLVEVSYKRATNTIAVQIDGSAAVTGVMTGWSQVTSRLSFLTAHDLVDGRLGGADGRGVAVAAIGVAAVYAPDSAAYRTALKAMASVLYPAITVA